MKIKLHRLFIVLAFTFFSLMVRSAGAQPVLGITNDATVGVSVFWPLADAGYSLQWTPDLLSPQPWQPYPDVPSLSGDGTSLIVNVTALEVTNPIAFFQLVSNTVTVPASPSVVTTAAGPVNTSTAGLNGSIQPNTFDTTWWFQWGTDTSYGQTTASGVVAGSNTVPVFVQLGVAGLAPGTTYHFQLYGSNIDGTTSGGDLTFTTVAPTPPPIIQTLAATTVTTTSAVLNGSIYSGFGQGVMHFQYGTDTSYTGGQVGTYFTAAPGDTEPYSFTLTGLAPNTTYHYRAFGFNCCTEGFGFDATFTTSASVQPQPPIVTTLAATSVTATGATLNATVNPNASTTFAAFLYGTSVGYGTSPGSFAAGSDGTAHSFSATLTGLTPNTTYHYTITAGNSGGSVEGADVSFTTGAGSQAPPIVQTLAATNVTCSSAILNGNANPNAAEAHSYFEYGTTTGYGSTTALSDLGAGGVIENLQYIIGSLLPNTTYHYRIVAYNSGGANDGADVTFTTGSCQARPAIQTLAASQITATAAGLNGSVNPYGSDTHTFFQWGTTASYGNTTGLADVGSGTGMQSDVFALSGGTLAPHTTYHYRLVGYNSAGTNAGADVAFATLPLPPSVTTGGANDVDGHGDAVLTANANPNGGNTSVYFEYGTTTSYGSTSSSTGIGSGTSAQPVGISVSGLAASTFYHFRAVATSPGGTVHGLDQFFNSSGIQ